MHAEHRLVSALGKASLVGALTLAAVASPTLAHAQASAQNIAEARKLFQEAIAFEDQARWQDALDGFRKVGEVKMTPQVRFHIAFAEENLGLFAAALTDYEQAETLARAASDPPKEVLENAPTRAAALRKRLPTVKIEVRGHGAFHLTLDGAAVARSALGTELPIDPGKHVVKLALDGDASSEAPAPVELTVTEGQKRAVMITLPEPLPKPGAAPLESPAPAPEKPSVPERKGTKVPAVVVGSIGIASLVGAGVFLGLRQSAIGQVRDGCSDAEHDQGCDPKLAGVAQNGRTYTYVSATLAAVGAASLAASAVLWFTVGADKPTSAAAKVTLSPSYVSFSARF